MPHTTRREEPESDERRTVVLEFVAAFIVFFIMALVIYMVFTYRPV
ncbi:MAG: hypothetical protein ACK5AZ_20140 [Bryobacteraceae bacterium]